MINEDEDFGGQRDYKSENEQLKQQIIELKTKLYDANVKEQRLLKILNETDDYT